MGGSIVSHVLHGIALSESLSKDMNLRIDPLASWIVLGHSSVDIIDQIEMVTGNITLQ